MEQLREFLRLLKRQHFWFLTPVLLLLGIVGWWLSSNKLNSEFDKYRAEVEGYSSKLRSVTGQTNHPNKDYHDGMTTMIEQRRDNVRTAWQTKWERQKQELKWPEELPEDFRRQVDQLRPIENVDLEKNREQDIPASLRRTYGAFIRNMLPKLAASIGARWQPERTGAAGTPQGFTADTAPSTDAADDSERQEESQVVTWNPRNQALFDQRFDWKNVPPTTHEVLYAQEDLWVLANLIDVIRRTNQDAPTRSQAVVKEIEFIQIAKDVQVPSFKVLRPAAPGGAAATGDSSDSGSDDSSTSGKQAETASGSDAALAEGADATKPNALAPLIKNRYVNENYAPIADLETLKGSVTVAKRIPVRMRLLVDQRHINRLLVECANSPLTFEVRQFRLNPRDDTLGDGRSFAGRSDGPAFEAGGGGITGVKVLPDYQSFDRIVELFGIVYIFNPVDDAILTGAPAESRTADLEDAGVSR